MEKAAMNEDSYLLSKNGDFPASHVSFRGGTLSPIIMEVENGYIER